MLLKCNFVAIVVYKSRVIVSPLTRSFDISFSVNANLHSSSHIDHDHTCGCFSLTLDVNIL